MQMLKQIGQQGGGKNIEACKEVLRHYRNHFPYLLDKVMDETEQERLMNMITPGALQAEIKRRFNELNNGIVIGEQSYFGENYVVRVPEKLFATHLHGIGKTGYGKSRFVLGLIEQILKRNNALIVFAAEPHIISDILNIVPGHRENDLIYLNATDKKTVTYNPFNIYDYENDDLSINLKIDALYSNFAHNLNIENLKTADEILRYLIHALVHTEGTTLMDIKKLLDLNKSKTRLEVARNLEFDAREFWIQKFPSLAKGAANPLLNRFGKLIGFENSPCRNVFCRSKSTLDIKQVMEQGKILIINLADAEIGETSARLIGQILFTAMQQTAMKRGTDEKMVYIVMDEFERYIHSTKTISRLLSECRKFNVSLILLHQFLGQMPQETLHSITGNVGASVAFNICHADAVKMSLEFPIWRDGVITNVHPNSFQDLGVRETIIRLSNKTFMMTARKMPRQWDKIKIEHLKQISRNNWGVEPEPVREKIDYDLEKISLNDSIFEVDPEVLFKN